MKPYYEDALVTLWHGDANELLSELKASVDCVLTDPPYGIAWSQHGGGKTGKSKGMRRLPPIIGDDDVSVRDAVLALLAPRPALVFGSFRAPFPASVVQVLVYRKTPDAGLVGSTTGFRRDAEPIFLLGDWPVRKAHRSSVVESRIGLQALAKPGLHPHAKPLDVLTVLLRALPAGTVMDPFAGSGTTLLESKNAGIPAVGIEIDEGYCEQTTFRLTQEVLELGA